MEGAWGGRLLHRAAKSLVLVIVGAAGLLLVMPAAGAGQVGIGASGSGVRVRVYTQMCDHGVQHTRLNVRNLNGFPVTISVSDPEAKSINLGVSGFIAAGTTKVVSITASPNAPARTATVSVSPGGAVAVPIPFLQCVEVGPKTDIVPPVAPYGPPKAATVVSAAPAATQVSAGTLPFTGSDARFMAAVAAVLILCGGAFVALQMRIDSRKSLLVGEQVTRRGVIGPF
jgi:hypothetical protein